MHDCVHVYMYLHVCICTRRFFYKHTFHRICIVALKWAEIKPTQVYKFVYKYIHTFHRIYFVASKRGEIKPHTCMYVYTSTCICNTNTNSHMNICTHTHIYILYNTHANRICIVALKRGRNQAHASLQVCLQIHTHIPQDMHRSLETGRNQAHTRMQSTEESLTHAQRMLEQHNSRWSRAYAQVCYVSVFV